MISDGIDLSLANDKVNAIKKPEQDTAMMIKSATISTAMILWMIVSLVLRKGGIVNGPECYNQLTEVPIMISAES